MRFVGIVVALAGLAGAARADLPKKGSDSIVPVVSDDQGWQRDRQAAYLAFGTSLTTDAYTNMDLFLEGGMRVSTTPIWVHGLIGTGAETQVHGQGDFLEARGGFEVSCGTRRIMCGFFAIDVGGEMQRRRGDKDEDALKGVVAVPRLGVDMGGDMVRLRASIDGRWFRYGGKGDAESSTTGGGGFSLALALRF
ncbi:MAG TPA: hypothetical protein VL463_23150 [Kofleriaceae bacterium]|jgi:hypothetical protein|nr:hypothetical protein [Kofleriaceae bacterium]